jgi:hypothetical protein
MGHNTSISLTVYYRVYLGAALISSSVLSLEIDMTRFFYNI